MYYDNFGNPRFDRMNRETQEHNNRNTGKYTTSDGNKYGYFNPYRQNYLNNETYRQNNGVYNKKYY